jgi:hypothetical protein
VPIADPSKYNLPVPLIVTPDVTLLGATETLPRTVRVTPFEIVNDPLELIAITNVVVLSGDVPTVAFVSTVTA